MKMLLSSSVVLGLCCVISQANADDNKSILELATCQQSWLDWRQEHARIKGFSAMLNANFKFNERENYFYPLRDATFLGHKISRVYPDTVGMGVGFSVVVDAGIDAIKPSFEKAVGKQFGSCSKEEGALSCELRIGEKKTVFLMETGREPTPQTLAGCYYYYEK